MALMKLILQQPVLCLAARCRLHTSYSSLIRPSLDAVYSKTATRGLTDSFNATFRRPIITVVSVSKERLLVRLCGRTLSEVQAKRYVHQTLLNYAKKKSPLEVSSKVMRDTLIFSYRNDTMFRMITFFGIVQFFFWVYMAFVINTIMKQVNAVSDEIDTSTFSGKVLVMMKDYSLKIGGMCILLGNVVLFFTMVYPKRSIKSLTLLKGGNNVKLTTYSYFGQTTQFTVPLEDTSFMQTRESKGAILAMKIKGHWWYYMLDKRTGVFHQNELFDRVVGFQRELKK